MWKCVSGSVLLAAVGAMTSVSNAASVNVFYNNAAITSTWGEQTAGVWNGYDGPSSSSTFAPADSSGYLTGPWTFNDVTESIAPAGSIAPGIAVGHGDLTVNVTPSGFAAIGHGRGTVGYGGASDYVVASGTSQFNLVFNVPADAVNYKLQLTGSASSNAYTMLTTRLAEFQMSADGKTVISQTTLPWGLITDGNANGTDASISLNGEFPLQAGYRYALDCYANANFPPATPDQPDQYQSEAMFDVTGVVVPEPAICLLLAGSLLLSLRRRAAESVA